MDKISGASGIARSITTRMNRKQSVTQGSGNNSSSGGAVLGRAFSLKRAEKPAPRPEISLPIELVSATNLLAFSAPDLPPTVTGISAFPKQLTAVSSSTSLRSDGSTPALSSASSTTLTFPSVATPTEELPGHQLTSLREVSAKSPAPSQIQQSPVTADKSSPSAEKEEAHSSPAPAVPSRAPSHTKKTHQVLARQRSISRMRSDTSAGRSSPPPLVSDSLSRKSTSSSRHQSGHSSKEAIVARSSVDMFSTGSQAETGAPAAAADPDHPFGAELAKLTEVAEEFSPRRERAATRSTTRSATRSRSRARTPPTPAMPPTPLALEPVPAMRKNKVSIEPTVWDEETEYLSKHGLRNFSAEEYMAEIGSPYTGTFPGSAL